MNQASPSLAIPFCQGLLATGLCGVALALLLLSQRLQQRPLQQGIVTLHVGAGNHVRLWNQPVRRQDIPLFLEAAARRRPDSRLRVIPAAQVTWGDLRELLQELQRGPLPVELQLPQGSAPMGSTSMQSTNRRSATIHG
jgi:hypothetical protein